MLEASRDKIDLWLVRYEELGDPTLLGRYRWLLSEAERVKETQFRSAKDQLRYLATRALVRVTLSRYVALAAKDWLFAANSYGKPEIANSGGGAESLSFNVSHTEGLIALGVCGKQALGVDVESLRRREPHSVELAARYFSPQETSALRALPEALQNRRFLEYWTLKESYIKAKGKGLSIPLDCLTMALEDETKINVSFSDQTDDHASRWRFWQIEPPGGYVMGVCAERRSDREPEVVLREVVPLQSEALLAAKILRQSA